MADIINLFKLTNAEIFPKISLELFYMLHFKQQQMLPKLQLKYPQKILPTSARFPI